MIQQRVMLAFPKDLVSQPFVSQVIKSFNIDINILQASITPQEDGEMFAIFSGEPDAVSSAVAYLREKRVGVTLPANNITRDATLCVHCGSCISQCLSGALAQEPNTLEVSFNQESCIGCKLCIPACAFNAIVPLILDNESEKES